MSTNIYENAPRYTAKEIEDGFYSGMDPDVEFVAAQYYDQMEAERDELRRRLGAILAVPEPDAPCPCKPFRWKQCTCGAYRRGDTSIGQIDGYADTMEVYEKFRAIAEGRDNG